MKFMSGVRARETEIINLFAATFAISEGTQEGALIERLVRSLLTDTPAEDFRLFTVWDGDAPIAGSVFSRMRYDQDPRAVFLLSPMAVTTERQGQGVGQALLQYGLSHLREDQADLVMTYGDPNFYSKAGFLPISQEVVPAPFALTYPEGWIGQRLTDTPLTPFEGSCRCVPALRDPEIW